MEGNFESCLSDSVSSKGELMKVREMEEGGESEWGNELLEGRAGIEQLANRRHAVGERWRNEEDDEEDEGKKKKKKKNLQQLLIHADMVCRE